MVTFHFCTVLSIPFFFFQVQLLFFSSVTLKALVTEVAEIYCKW